VRFRRLTRGPHPRPREVAAAEPGHITAHSATASASYDIVKAVRIDGKPRHKFVLGLGSQKNDRNGRPDFWCSAVERMTRHGLTEEQRRYFVEAMVRKGAEFPTREDYDLFVENWPRWTAVREIENLIPTRRRRKATPVKAKKAMVKAVKKKAVAKNPPVKVKKGPMLADNARYAPRGKLDWHQPNKRIPVERAYGMVPMSPSTPTQYRHVRRMKNGDVEVSIVRYERDADVLEYSIHTKHHQGGFPVRYDSKGGYCSDSGIIGRPDTLDEAKALAQAHFERRLAGLEVAPAEACEVRHGET
jgi:hypothetical protein